MDHPRQLWKICSTFPKLMLWQRIRMLVIVGNICAFWLVNCEECLFTITLPSIRCLAFDSTILLKKHDCLSIVLLFTTVGCAALAFKIKFADADLHTPDNEDQLPLVPTNISVRRWVEIKHAISVNLCTAADWSERDHHEHGTRGILLETSLRSAAMVTFPNTIW